MEETVQAEEQLIQVGVVHRADGQVVVIAVVVAAQILVVEVLAEAVLAEITKHIINK